MNRVCKECNELKDISSFPVNYKKEDKIYYRRKCKDCYRPKRKEYERNYNKLYYENKKKYKDLINEKIEN